MNLIFCYLLVGWKSFVYNDKVLDNALFNNNFRILDRKYYLIDTRYNNTDCLFCSYCNVQYYLKKQAVVGKKSKNKKQLFNFHYLSLCNIIEKIYKITK